MNKLNELIYLRRENALACTFVHIQPECVGSVPAQFMAKQGSLLMLMHIWGRVLKCLNKWGQVFKCLNKWVHVFTCLNNPGADASSHCTACCAQHYIWFIDCCIVEVVHGFECCWCPLRPVLQDVLRGVMSTQRLLSGIVMSCTRQSLSVLIKEPSGQVIIETLHCILNLVRTQVDALKLMCNKFIVVEEKMVEGRQTKVPRMKPEGEVMGWDSAVHRNNSVKKKDAWRGVKGGFGYDFEEVLGFRERCRVGMETYASRPQISGRLFAILLS
jgi:hypothetical protein